MESKHWIVGKNCSGKTQLVKKMLGCKKIPRSKFYGEQVTNGTQFVTEIHGHRVHIFITGTLNVQRIQTIQHDLGKIEKNLARVRDSFEEQVLKYNENERKKKIRDVLLLKIDRLVPFYVNWCYRGWVTGGYNDEYGFSFEDFAAKFYSHQVHEMCDAEYDMIVRLVNDENTIINGQTVAHMREVEWYWAEHYGEDVRLGEDEAWIRVAWLIDDYEEEIVSLDIRDLQYPSRDVLTRWESEKREVEQQLELILTIAPIKVWLRRISDNRDSFCSVMKRIGNWNVTELFVEGVHPNWLSYSYDQLEFPKSATTYFETPTNDETVRVIPFSEMMEVYQ